jgi:hypothetical protein
LITVKQYYSIREIVFGCGGQGEMALVTAKVIFDVDLSGGVHVSKPDALN